MTTNFKPTGYTSVSPYVIVNDAARVIDFLVATFDAKEIRRFPGKNGKLMHAEVRLDDTVVMLADSNDGWPAVATHVHVYVPDVDATYRRALQLGATSVREPIKSEDDDKRGGVKDPEGTTTWWIATKVT